MDKKWINDVTIENAKFHYKDFAGKKFGNGARSIGVVLTKEQADQLVEDGWKVKVLEATEEYPDEKYYINIKMKYGMDRNGNYRHPDIYMIAGNKMTLLDEGNVGELDKAEIQNVDLTFGPNFFENSITAYLKKMYVTIQQDVLSQKYACYEQQSPIDDYVDGEEF